MQEWIGYYDKVIHREDCDAIISYPWEWTPSTYSNNKGKVKSSDERVRMDECWCVDVNRPYPLLKKSVIKVMKLYAKEQKFFSCIHHTDFRLNRYGVGGFMSEHCDNIHHSHGQTYGYPQATVLFFLNDDFDGGHTCFNECEIKPETGKLLIFSNSIYEHSVSKVVNGERFALSIWYNQ